jgi:hypothetical protein
VAKGAIFIGWGENFPGYGEKGFKVFKEAMEFNKRMQQQGEIDSFEPVLLDYHGGDLLGFTLFRGDREKLNRLRMNPEFQSINHRASLVVKNYGVIDAFTEDEVQRRMEDQQKQVSDLD